MSWRRTTEREWEQYNKELERTFQHQCDEAASSQECRVARDNAERQHQARIRVVTPDPLNGRDSFKDREGSMRMHSRHVDVTSAVSNRRPSLFSTQQQMSPPASPPQPIRHRHSQRDMTQMRPSAGRTTSEQNTPRSQAPVFGSPFQKDYADAIREVQSRPRTRTLDERRTNDSQLRDASPGSFLRKSRKGSMASTTSSAYHAGEDTVASIGHPSTVSTSSSYQTAPAPGSGNSSWEEYHQRTQSKSSRNKLAKAPPARPSPVDNRAIPNPIELPIPPRAIPTISPRKTLNLMRSSEGRMEGMLAFRRGETAPWNAAFCTIDDEEGALVYEPKRGATFYTSLISDLRCCHIRAAIDVGSSMPYLIVNPPCSHIEIHLRPTTVVDEFENWFAALLCWRPIMPKGIGNRQAKTQPGMTKNPRPLSERRHSEISLKSKASSVEAAVIKVGSMILWDVIVSRRFDPAAKPFGPRTSRRWRRVSAHLCENGEFKLFMDQSVDILYTLQLNRLSRCAIQRLDSSVLDTDFCIAIYPQYTSDCLPADINHPILLSCETRVLYEVWLVLLRAFTLPSLYGPQGSMTPEDATSDEMRRNFFRMERSVHIHVQAAQVNPPGKNFPDDAAGPTNHPSSRAHASSQSGGYYVEVLLDGEARAKSKAKADGPNPFWSEKFDFSELPTALSVVTVVLRERPDTQSIGERQARAEAKRLFDSTVHPFGDGSSYGGAADAEIGTVNLYVDDLSRASEVREWFMMNDNKGRITGKVQLSLRAEEKVILMAREYQPLSELLHRFSNGLTLQIAQVLSNNIGKLSEYLLNIFQVSGKASEWTMMLVEDEIDNAGASKDGTSVPSRNRFGKRMSPAGTANNSNVTLGDLIDEKYSVDRELFVRDASKNAAQETNVLFRGNTLCTKSLDLHMRRLGHEYIQATLGDKLKKIADENLDCEVDPNKIENAADLDRNWKKLLGYTGDIWKAISDSANQCPTELRFIFRHIMGCADDRWGEHQRTVRYTSVSGFLFLRFFCPAILSPQLFGLVKSTPRLAALTTLKFVAKILQNLANLSTFGVKETWMERANFFVTSNRQRFKDFIDHICSVPSDASAMNSIPPSYNTPIAMLSRLSPGSREGFPSLPYLIDHPRSFADLVSLWLGGIRDPTILKAIAGHGEYGNASDLQKFHQLCLALKQREKDLFEQSEAAKKPSKDLEEQWENVVDELVRETLDTYQGPAMSMDSVFVPSSPPGGPHVNSSHASLPLRTSNSNAADRGLKNTGAPGGGSTGPASLSSSVSHYAPSESTADTGEPPRATTSGSGDVAGGTDCASQTSLNAGFGAGGGYGGEAEGATALPDLDGRDLESAQEVKRDKTRKEEKEPSKKTGLLGRFGKKKQLD